MAAYVIVRVEVSDKEQYKKYIALTPASITKFGGRFIVRGGETISLEGDEDKRRIVILEFPTLKRAEEWYHSEDYQAAKKVRAGAAEAEFIVSPKAKQSKYAILFKNLLKGVTGSPMQVSKAVIFIALWALA